VCDDPRMSITYDPESIRDGVCTLLTDTGIEVFGSAPEETYFAKIVRNPDGSHTRVSTGAGSTYPAPIEVVNEVLNLAPRDAAMIGLYHMLRNVSWRSFDLLDVVKGQARLPFKMHQFEDIAFDWMEWGVEDMPSGKMLITSATDDSVYEQHTDVRLLEETYGVYEPGTLLRYLGEQTIQIELVCWCAHKDQRRGLEAKLLEELAAEKVNDLPGRRVVIPEYFNRTARYMLRSSSRPDDAARAGAHEFQLIIPVAAEIEHVVLVRSPGLMRMPGADVETE